MESPVVVDKPPEYHGKDDRGFPFDEAERSDAWSDLAARHPDIAARLRQHPAAWARKRRVSGHNDDDFGDSFSGFDRFPFDDIPPEFREHFPSHWNRRFSSREEPSQEQQQPQSPSQQSTSTQTEHEPANTTQPQQIPQYGLRNTVDLGQRSAVDPSVVDAEARGQRSMSAPPETMSAPPRPSTPQAAPDQPAPQSKVRTIPIFVEGRDSPVINESLDNTTQFADSKPQHHPHPPPDPYFADEPIYQQPPNFSRAFGTPFGKNYRQNQPFAHQKVYPQTAAFARGASPGRSQSPKPHEEIKIPVHHEKPQARPEPRPQPKPQQPSPQQHQAPPQQHHQAPPQQQHPAPPQQPKQQTPPPQPAKQQCQPPDPITQILAIQTDVLNLMTEVEKFTGTKKDKRYIYLDEMLTRNLIKLDTIETEGKENIRNARKEAIRCIQKCIAVLEAKADGRSLDGSQPQESQPSQNDVDMNAETEKPEDKRAENGEVDMKEAPKEEVKVDDNQEQHKNEQNAEMPSEQNKESAPQAADTRPDVAPPSETPNATPADGVDDKLKKEGKTKKRDKSKEKSEKKSDKSDEKKEMTEAMQIDDKGDKKTQQMEVDGASSQ